MPDYRVTIQITGTIDVAGTTQDEAFRFAEFIAAKWIEEEFKRFHLTNLHYDSGVELNRKWNG